MNIGSTINTAYGDSLYGDWCGSISNDGLTLFFSSARPPGSASNLDMWMTKRATREDEWDPPIRLPDIVNSYTLDGVESISTDGSILYFSSYRPGGFGDVDFWETPILPIVDFNGDGNIDTDDLLILIGYWGQKEPLCDIGPKPYGDGIVDIKDLEVFMSYWEKENMPETPEEEI